MRSPLAAMTVIACPQCGTRYQVPAATLGASGRQVQCAHCAGAWLATAESVPSPSPSPVPEPADADRLFDKATERDLDAAFAAEEQAVLAEAPVPVLPAPAADVAVAAMPRTDPRLKQKRERAFARRQNRRSARLPVARLRRVARVVTLGLLAALIGGGLAFRTEIVAAVPDLAGAYAALGFEVNTVGLDFANVHTLLALRGGSSVLQVGARIESISRRPVAVPPVVVTLLDAEGSALYEWSVTAGAADLEPGEAVDFSSQLASPPAAAQRVRLTFGGGRAKSETPIAAEPAAEPAR